MLSGNSDVANVCSIQKTLDNECDSFLCIKFHLF